jgi:hypothetical protein
MIKEERFKNFPAWLQKTMKFPGKIMILAKIVYIVISLRATIWYLFRVIPKRSMAAYSCLQVAAPVKDK